MIAELFYPKELKEIIADLRAKDDLNEEALKRLNNIPFVVFIFWLLVIAFYFFTLKSQDYFIAAFCISALIAIFLIIKEIKDGCTRVLAYRNGVLKKAKIIKFLYHLRNPTVKIKIKDIETSQVITLGPFRATKDFKHNFPKFEEEISYYTIGTKSSQNMPDYLPIKKQYCLSLSMLKDEQS